MEKIFVSSQALPSSPRENIRLGYRSFFSVPRTEEHEPITAATAQLYSWLRQKRYDVDSLKQDRIVTIAHGVTASILRLEDRDGSETFRAKVTEVSRSREAWESVLTVHVPGRITEAASVLLDISGPFQPRTPKLAGMLTGALPAYDSMALLTHKPLKVSIDDVERVAEAVCDPDRRGLLFISGMNSELPYDLWYRYVSSLLKETTGLAASYFLDPAATAAFREIMGSTHAVTPGTVRTYLPDADPASDLDALRHRILGTERIIRDSSRRLARVLAGRAQEETLQAQLPVKMRRTQRRIAEHADQLLLRPISQAAMEPAVVTPSLATPGEVISGDWEVEPETAPDGFQRLVQAARSIVRRVLGKVDPSEDDWELIAQLALQGKSAGAAQVQVARQLRELRDELEDQESVQSDLQSRLQDEQLEHAAAAEELGTLQRRNAYIEGLLQRTEMVGELYSEAVTTAPEPADYEELLTGVGDFKYVLFTGDQKTTLSLDQHDPLGVWAGKTWKILCALEDYGRTSSFGECSTDVEGYLRHVPDGCRGYSLNKHAPTESEDVQRNSKFRDARVFTVPTSVKVDGRVEMMAHFKIAQSGLISPRLHYHDDTTRSGKVYVGYIGPHLPTKRTN